MTVRPASHFTKPSFSTSSAGKVEIIELTYGTLNGVKEAVFAVRGANAFGELRSEAGVHRVQRVFHIHISAHTAQFLRFGHDMLAERGLPGRLRPVDFNDAALGQSANAERDVEAQ